LNCRNNEIGVSFILLQLLLVPTIYGKSDPEDVELEKYENTQSLELGQP
jgi:hypothetical protein